VKDGLRDCGKPRPSQESAQGELPQTATGTIHAIEWFHLLGFCSMFGG
jgi:hypothetical protein